MSAGALHAEVLIVEDDADIAALLAHRVTRQGHRPTVARTGADALDAARTARPDLVLLDLGLPDIHGWDVLDAIRGDERTADVPVLVVSIADEGDDAAHDVQGHITKPFTAADLDRSVAAALSPSSSPSDLEDRP